MTAKKWLQQIRRLNREIDALESAKNWAYSSCTSGISHLRTVPIGGSGDKRSFEDYLELSAEINQAIDELREMKEYARGLISHVPNLIHRQLLNLYYVECQTWEQVTAALSTRGRHYSVNYVRMKLHRQALSEITTYCDGA